MNTRKFSVLALTFAYAFGATCLALQSNDWPVWGQNPANTRSNALETNVPGSSTMFQYWNTAPASGSGNNGVLGVRYGVIANNRLYGSYTLGTASYAEGRTLTGTSKGSMLPGWPNVPANPGQKFTSLWTYFPPSFLQAGSSTGYIAFTLGGNGSNPCTASAASIQVLDGLSGALMSKSPIALPNQTSRIGVGSTAVQSSTKYYASAFCLTGTNPVNTYAFTIPSGPFSGWPQGSAPNNYRQFATGDTFASFSPAVDGGRVILALGLANTVSCPIPGGGTGEIKVISDSSGTDFCTVGPFATTFDNTPPAVVGNLAYSVNFPSLGPSVFDLTNCTGGAKGGCDILIGSTGAGAGQGMAIANGLVFISAPPPLTNTVEMWDSTLSTLYDTFTVVDPNQYGPFPVQPYIAEANRFIYGVNGHGLVFAAAYDVTPTPQFVVSRSSYSSDVSGSTVYTGGVSAVGDGCVVVSSPTDVRVYKLDVGPTPSSTTIVLPSCGGTIATLHNLDSVFDPTTSKFLDARIVGTRNGSPNTVPISLVYRNGAWTCGPAPIQTVGCEPLEVYGVSLTDSATGVATGIDTCQSVAYTLTPTGGWSGAATVAPTLPGFSGASVARIRGTSFGWSFDGAYFVYFDGVNWTWSPTLCPSCPQAPGSANPPDHPDISFARGDVNSGWAAYGQNALWEIGYTTPGIWDLTATPSTDSRVPAGSVLAYAGVSVNSSTDRWACGYEFQGGQAAPIIVHSTVPGSTPIMASLSMPPAPLDDINTFPILFGITFYEPDRNRGIAVGTAVLASGSTTVAPAYMTLDHGANWTSFLVNTAPLTNPSLNRVRFVDLNTAYAIGWAFDPGAGGAQVPILVKITLY